MFRIIFGLLVLTSAIAVTSTYYEMPMEQHLDHEPFNQSVMETLVGDDTVCTDVSSVQVNKTCEEYTTYDKPELKNLTYSGILVGGILFLVVSIKAVF